MQFRSVVTFYAIAFAVLSFTAPRIEAAAVLFEGHLDLILENSGGAIYSSAVPGTLFTGEIDDVTAVGEITDGSTPTAFTLCCEAGGLALSNDVEVDQNFLDLLDLLAPNLPPGVPTFSLTDKYDLVDLEGGATTGDGRIEVGVSMLLKDTAFDSTDLSNYPFDESDLLLTLFFIIEEDATTEIYNVLGVVDNLTLPNTTPIPIPAGVWLLGSGIAFVAAWARRKKTPRSAGRF